MISTCALDTGEKSGAPFLYWIPLIPASSNIRFNTESGGGLNVLKDSPLIPSNSTFELIGEGVWLYFIS